MQLQRLSRVAVLAALAFLLMLLEVNIPPFAEFLKYDPGDVPAMVATYTMGPAAGVGVQGLKALLFWASGRSTAGWIGVLANFLAGAALVLGAGLSYRLFGRFGLKGWVGDVGSAVVGTLIMTLVLIPVLAVMVYPLWGMTGSAAWSAVLYLSTPFNLFKGLVSTTLSLAFYRRLAPYLQGSQRTAA